MDSWKNEIDFLYNIWTNICKRIQMDTKNHKAQPS